MYKIIKKIFKVSLYLEQIVPNESVEHLILASKVHSFNASFDSELELDKMIIRYGKKFDDFIKDLTG